MFFTVYLRLFGWSLTGLWRFWRRCCVYIAYLYEGLLAGNLQMWRRYDGRGRVNCGCLATLLRATDASWKALRAAVALARSSVIRGRFSIDTWMFSWSHYLVLLNIKYFILMDGGMITDISVSWTHGYVQSFIIYFC